MKLIKGRTVSVHLCGAPMTKAKNGADRGFCTHFAGHASGHRNGTCPQCGIKLTKHNVYPAAVTRKSGSCQKCEEAYRRKYLGQQPLNRQRPGELHTFPCGCSGTLPGLKGVSNQFAMFSGSGWFCRVGRILNASLADAKKDKCAPIDPATPHAIIRALMDIPLCERCRRPLMWEIGAWKTPHLHHSHESGEVFGFTHAKCNPRAVEIENDRLKDENARLTYENNRLNKAAA